MAWFCHLTSVWWMTDWNDSSSKNALLWKLRIIFSTGERASSACHAIYCYLLFRCHISAAKVEQCSINRDEKTILCLKVIDTLARICMTTQTMHTLVTHRLVCTYSHDYVKLKSVLYQKFKKPVVTCCTRPLRINRYLFVVKSMNYDRKILVWSAFIKSIHLLVNLSIQF